MRERNQTKKSLLATIFKSIIFLSFKAEEGK